MEQRWWLRLKIDDEAPESATMTLEAVPTISAKISIIELELVSA
jgi:hypothetical protein